jgi:sugar O-acyltransferase (sialic acid O-acetyltransferase NeuD family)
MHALRIIGAGGHGKVVADVAFAMGYRDIAFLDAGYPGRKSNGSWPICGTPDVKGSEQWFCAVGSNATRAHLFKTLDLNDAPSLIHPFTSVSPSANLGCGTLLVAGVVVNADVQVGRGAILNTGCSVDHDCILDDFVHISPGARLAGNVQVGAGSWIGIGAVVRESVRIGSNVVIGAGAAVIGDIPDNTRFGGVPARAL